MFGLLVSVVRFLVVFFVGLGSMGAFLEVLSLAPDIFDGLELVAAHVINATWFGGFFYVYMLYVFSVIERDERVELPEVLTPDDVFVLGIPMVRDTYGKSACTCDSATCKGAHWKHWACPSPDMDVVTWERMKLSHVRPVSSVTARRPLRVHSVVSLSVFSG
jgi:hypothetical protein